ncbi:phytoene/squalene synthase family protein [Nakamurella endophytica]|uniref:Phytoene synthase n=1 Tax=Nakamurella endophytica TaxID=1748367 RepID=A0A917T7J4_9ACTN|nr:phytoene/squalene synthase family protein [Nakamurella endophytica]GGM12128.1 phytoene synthase [Nakamurella endophytica]
MSAADLAERQARLDRGYRECRRLTWRYGTTYYWGAAILAPDRRRHVHAVYALCRLADDIVDDPPPGTTGTAGHTGAPGDTAARLADFATGFRTALAAGDADEPVLAAVVDTVLRCDIDPECFDRFFGAMAMDLTTTTYRTWADLLGYMEGSAAVIGEMMLPVLRPTRAGAREPARALGFAFQLTNFLRDVDEDLDRGRVYLPQEDLERFGVDVHERRVTPQWRAMMAFQISRNRRLYREADTGIALLPGRSARCVGAARVLYSRILDRIERADHDVFTGRARVPTWQKAATAARIVVAGPGRAATAGAPAPRGRAAERPAGRSPAAGREGADRVR